jgi:VanZ family protein
LAVRNNQWKPWVPVFVWLGVLALESSDLGSSDHTGHLLRKLWTALFGQPDAATFELVHHLIRKTGHFLGYAILSWLIFRAVRASWRNRQEILSRGRDYFWQLRWAVLGVAGTAVAASVDEIHQTFNPARTGRWQDVVLDTSGALAIQIILFLALAMGSEKAETETSRS